jgi:hypothetical protein
MKRLLLAAIVTMAVTGPAWAQSSTATTTGVARSSSNSGAFAGSGNSSSSLVINNPANTTSTVNSNVSGTTTSNVNYSGGTRSEQVVSGTTTVRNAPGIVAPGLSAAGLETCLGSASGGASVVGFGATFGTSVPDPGCNARLDARALWSIGLKKAAVARLCLSPDIYRSMPEVCVQYLPPTVQPVPVGYPAPPPSPYHAEGAYRGGLIMLVDGASGKERLCNDYNEGKQKCRQWADAAPRFPRVKTKVASAAVPMPKPKPPVVTADAKPAVGFAEPEAETKAEPKAEPKKD